jgi:hypothetical protein
MVKKRAEVPDEVPDIRRRDPTIPIKCGDCVFHTNLATYGRPCSELGTLSAAKTCARFVADPAQLGEAADVGPLLRAIAGVRNGAMVASIVLSSRKVGRLGFRLGQTVYFRVMGGDFLCNYARAIVIGASGRDLVLSGVQTFRALVGASQLMDRDAWEVKRARLVKAGRIDDPDGGLRKIEVRGRERLVAYEPLPLGSGSSRRKKPARGKTNAGKRRPITINA